MNRLALVCAGVVAIAVGYILAVDVPEPRAADHGDSPSLADSPLADINDLYAWMVGEDGETPPGPTHLALAMTVHRNYPDATAVFDLATTYRFHITAIDDTDPDDVGTADYTLSCVFAGDGSAVPQTHVCTLAGGTGVATATGDNDAVTGAATDNLRVFAGVRDDPFFFNLTGFVETVAIVNGAAGDLTFNDEGCPTLTDGTAEALVACLTTSCNQDGDPAENDFAGENVLAIVATVAKSELEVDGEPATKFHVWAATRVGGDQLDRMGRPAINTALINGFGLIDDDGALKNDYNAADDPEDWGDFADEIKKNLAILDALDSTGPAE
jgi:hypothetical protein